MLAQCQGHGGEQGAGLELRRLELKMNRPSDCDSRAGWRAKPKVSLLFFQWEFIFVRHYVRMWFTSFLRL